MVPKLWGLTSDVRLLRNVQRPQQRNHNTTFPKKVLETQKNRTVLFLYLLRRGSNFARTEAKFDVFVFVTLF